MTVPAPAQLENRTLGEAALAWAAMGWPVFPVVPRGKTPYGTGDFCRRDDDHDCGFHCATADPEQIAEWWGAHPDSNIGLTSPTAVFVDEDRIGALAEAGVKLPKCPWATTGRPGGGRHFFLRAPTSWPGLRGEDAKVVNRLAGVELKGFDKGYVVVAPSVHASGTRYAVQLGGYVPEISEKILDVLSQVELMGGGPASGFITVAGGGYALPDQVGTGGRYEAIRSYVAHLYNRGLTADESWPLVRSLLAPKFEPRLSERELRDRFARAVEDMPKRLGPPRTTSAAAAVSSPTTLEDAPLTEFDSSPIEWLWPAWLARGVVTLLDGNPGVSKSTVVADLISRMTTGREWPDGQAGLDPMRILYVTTEDDPGRVLRPRIEAAGGDASRVLFVRSEVVFPSGATAFRELVVRRAQEPLGLAAIVLDPLFSHLDASVRTVSDNEMRKGVMDPLGDIAESTQTAVLVVRHFNKDTRAGALNRGAGSLGGIVGAARALWTAVADPEDDSGETKAIGVEKLNYARPRPPLRYRVIDRYPPGWINQTVSGVEWLGEAAVTVSTMLTEDSSTRDAVPVLTAYLRSQGGSAPAVAIHAHMKARGFGRDATSGAKKRLHVKTSKVGMAGGWTWSLNGLGHEDAEESGGEESGAASSASSAASSRAHAGGTRSPDSSDSSGGFVVVGADSANRLEDAEESGSGAPPARARTREAEPTLTVVRDGAPSAPASTWCHYVVDHARKHHDTLTASPWCEICSPRTAS